MERPSEPEAECLSFPSGSEPPAAKKRTERPEMPVVAEQRQPENPNKLALPSSHDLAESGQQVGSMTSDHEVTTRGPPATREMLSERAQHFIDEINEKRKRDTTLLDDFRKAMLNRVNVSCDALEQQMYDIYEKSGKTIQPKLQEMYATLDRIAAIEEELEQFRNGLGALYKDIEQAET